MCKKSLKMVLNLQILLLSGFRRQLMDKTFLENMKAKLLEQKKTLSDSLADQSEDMKNLVKTVEWGRCCS